MRNSVRDASTPFTAATYGSRVPKSVSSAMIDNLREISTPAVFNTIAPPPNRLLIFARIPELGRVKTRLAEAIGVERALAVYRAMLRDVLRNAGASDDRLEIEVVWAPSECANGERLRDAFGDRSLAMQTGDTLGDRLSMAFSGRLFFHRTQKIIAIGVDEPALTRADIDQALELLESCEWVIGPAEDGGYYLIGCRGGAFDSEVFAEVDWGTDRVLMQTLSKIREREATVALLPVRHDIDVVEDLRRYAAAENEGELAELLVVMRP